MYQEPLQQDSERAGASHAKWQDDVRVCLYTLMLKILTLLPNIHTFPLNKF